MSASDVTDTGDADPRPAGSMPGVGGLGSFRGRTNRVGVPVLPPGWRPLQDGGVDPASRATEVAVRPIEPPPVVPAGARAVVPASPAVAAPEARVVPTPPAAAEVKVVRKVRPWSVWKLTFAFALCLVAIVATAGALLWAMAASLGVLGNLEGFIEDMGFDNVTFNGRAMLKALMLGGLIVSVAASLMAAVLAVMLNLLSDLTGGIEAELAPKRSKRRTSRKGRASRRRRSRPSRAARRKAAKASVEKVNPPEPEPPSVPDRPAPADEAVAVAGVEVKPRNGAEVLDLTEDVDVVDGPHEVDRIQLALDELLADPPGANGNGSAE